MSTIISEALAGNFSFFILVVGLLQLGLMLYTITLTKKTKFPR